MGASVTHAVRQLPDRVATATYTSFDKYLQSGPYNFGFGSKPDFVEHFPYQNGLLVSYWDTSQGDNNASQHPGEGLILPVDANPAPIVRSSAAASGVRGSAGYDAPFGLEKSDSFTLHLGDAKDTASYIRGQAAAAAVPRQRVVLGRRGSPRASVKVPNNGVEHQGAEPAGHLDGHQGLEAQLTEIVIDERRRGSGAREHRSDRGREVLLPATVASGRVPAARRVVRCGRTTRDCPWMCRTLRLGSGTCPKTDIQMNGGGSAYGLDDHIYQRLLRERIIFLGSEVRDQNANAICAQMLLLSAEDPETDIFLHINSPGGSVDSGMAIYDTMNYIPNDVATVGMGLAASMGQFLLCAGAAGKRYALPHARIMMHQPSGGMGGSASDIKIQAQQSLHIKKVLFDLISQHTGQPLEQVEADADRDRWFTAEQAKEYGFIDNVISSARQVADEGRPARNK